MKKNAKSACPLCASRYRSAANSMRELGASTTEIADCCGIDPASVEGHFTTCLKPAALSENDKLLGGTDDELRALLRDAEENYHAATVSGNQAAASSSLNVRLRILAALGNREQMSAERQVSEGDDPTDPRTWTPERSEWVRQYFDSVLSREARQLGKETVQ